MMTQEVEFEICQVGNNVTRKETDDSRSEA